MFYTKLKLNVLLLEKHYNIMLDKLLFWPTSSKDCPAMEARAMCPGQETSPLGSYVVGWKHSVHSYTPCYDWADHVWHDTLEIKNLPSRLDKYNFFLLLPYLMPNMRVR